ncbi:hypothetical protein LTR36_000126 [Oleoguttula mirabilis]|uniref:Uncharacterized protein n=1 Tax=Oleoguttula mirabilis TaxID=1507867 RepID=A0AAV9JZE7_9PEZI|nr:hypothetical protein LTR36_000126 [Oleoguttula mirabilis]
MDRGRIPGYYYDEEKKKYFKIQANHVAPADAKYSKSNVKFEERKAKKRKVEDRSRARRFKQTVRPSQISEHPISGGVGLGRELGLRGHAVNLKDRDAFFVSQLRPARTHITAPNAACRFGTLFEAATVEGTSVLAYNHAGGSSVYMSCADDSTARAMMPLVAFSSPLLGVHTIVASERTTLVACTHEPKPPGNIFVGGFTDHFSAGQDVFLRVGGSDSSLWASSINGEQHLAVSSTEAVFILDIASATSTYRVPVEEESRDLTWLNNRTVAYGEGRRVALFDTRSSGKSTRFQRNLPITAITSPGQSGLHLLVADNRRIDLYDTRMEKTPLFGFRHSHQGPQLQLTTNCSAAGSGLVAALDINNDIQTYNIRTGKVVGMLQRPLVKGKSLMTKLRWTEVAGGAPALQACQDNGLVKWTFGGTEDDEATRSHHRLP